MSRFKFDPSSLKDVPSADERAEQVKQQQENLLCLRAVRRVSDRIVSRLTQSQRERIAGLEARRYQLQQELLQVTSDQTNEITANFGM